MYNIFIATGFVMAMSSAAYAAPPSTRSFAQAVVASCPGSDLRFGCAHSERPGDPYRPATSNQTYVESYAARVPGVEAAAITGAAYGSASARVFRQGGSLFPTLKAGTFTNNTSGGYNASGFGSSYTRYAYRYTGEFSIALPIRGAIHTDIGFAPLNPFFYAYGQVASRLAIVDATVFAAYYGDSLINPASLSCGQPGVMAAASDLFTRGSFANNGTGAGHNSILDVTRGCTGAPLTINPNVDLYIFAGLETYAQRGAFTDATHTFTIDFADDAPAMVVDQLRQSLALNTSVPEPAMWGTMILGLGLIGGAARARRRAWQAT